MTTKMPCKLESRFQVDFDDLTYKPSITSSFLDNLNTEKSKTFRHIQIPEARHAYLASASAQLRNKKWFFYNMKEGEDGIITDTDSALKECRLLTILRSWTDGCRWAALTQQYGQVEPLSTYQRVKVDIPLNSSHINNENMVSLDMARSSLMRSKYH